MSSTISIVSTEAELKRCYPVVKQLRPDLSLGQFIERVELQQKEGFQLVALFSAEKVHAVAGIRILNSLADGRFLYVDDLVTDEAERSNGYGKTMFEWIVNHAKAAGCQSLELDSRVHRFEAHRFYLRQRMDISCHHFSLKLA